MRIVLGVEYDGCHYHGWQRQKNTKDTVQERVEKAISTVANHSIAVVCAGRTDARVHALEQVIHFESDEQRTAYQWVMGINSQLPSDIRIMWMKEACDDFHARYSAAARYYRYEILNRGVHSALKRDQITAIFRPLDAALMQLGANHLIGEHDFTSFRAKGCQAKSSIKTVHVIHIERRGDKIIVDIIASAFLHHMVRNIIGTLLPVGLGEVAAGWVKQVLLAKDRCAAGATAPPYGLYFKAVYYPKRFGLPSHPKFSLFEQAIEENAPPVWAVNELSK